MNNLIEIKNLNKTLFIKNGLKKTIFKNLSLDIPDSDKGKVYTIIAPNGSGKTILLKIISGIDNFDSGTVNISESVSSIKPIITETNSVLPWLDVKQNILIWLRSRKEKISDEKINYLMEDVGLSDYEHYFPNNKNSGFQFRIALARALAFSPNIILIDDSFKSFDLETRNELNTLIKKIINKYSIKFILTTTNLIDALFLSDHIYLMTKNPSEIILELKNENNYFEIQSMLLSDTFKQLSQEIQSKFQSRSGLASIHYSL